MKEFLSRAGRPFVVRNVDDSDDAYRELVAMGVMSVPFTLIGDARVTGFNPKALTEALDRLGRP